MSTRTATGLLLAPLLAISTSTSAPAKDFSEILERQGYRFTVQGTDAGSINTLRITVRGGRMGSRTFRQEIDGRVVGAEAADLDGNGSPEVYVYVSSAGSGSYGSLVAYGVNAGRSATPITLPDLADDPVAGQGYMGHDQFRVAGRTLVRMFPVYRDGDPQAQPSGGHRRVQYQLVTGEAGWRLRLDASRTENY